ncbi:MAG: response regulator [Synergistales bacterium]|nr:response regulator [Synergistales bacterium]
MTLFIGAVDDDRDILYTLEAMAASQGWNMQTTADPAQCLGWVRDDAVDILLVDYHMPTRNGREVVLEARRHSSKVLLVALTVEDREDIARELLLAGADDFVTKPLRLADFASRIRLHTQLVEQRRTLHWEERSKGLNEETERRVLQYVKGAPGPMGCREVGAGCNLASVTARRYLEHLVSRGTLSRCLGDPGGRPGRPPVLYTPAGD